MSLIWPDVSSRVLMRGDDARVFTQYLHTNDPAPSSHASGIQAPQQWHSPSAIPSTENDGYHVDVKCGQAAHLFHSMSSMWESRLDLKKDTSSG
jgi:hypothetical protein